jgi:hypothetical protein
MLQINTVVKYSGTLCRVKEVSEMRAVLVPLAHRKQSEKEQEKYGSLPKNIVVSPNAELPIIDKAGKRGKK